MAGRRANAAVRFRVDDIDLTNHVIRGIDKGGKFYEIPTTPELEALLKECVNARPAQATHPYLLWRRDDPSKPLSRTGAWLIVSRIGWEALGRAIWPHLLRHTFATSLYRKTSDLGLVQQALQHSRISTTTIYAHPGLEDLRRGMAATDGRSRWRRVWDGLKPRTIPDLLKSKHGPTFIGELIGRDRELAEMRQVFRAGGRDCVLIADPGTGRKTLLRALYETQKKRPGHVYEMETLRSVRGALSKLYEDMKKDGLPVGELPSDKRSVEVWLDAIKPATGDARVTVFIYDSDDANIPALRDLGEICTIFTATTPEGKQKVQEALFSFHEINVPPLSKPATLALADRVMERESASVPDRKGYLNHVWHESAGNPKGVIAMIEETRVTGEQEPEFTASRKVLPATPILTVIWTAVVISRYSASAISEPQLKVWATIILFGLLPFIALDKLLNMRRRKQK